MLKYSVPKQFQYLITLNYLDIYSNNTSLYYVKNPYTKEVHSFSFSSCKLNDIEKEIIINKFKESISEGGSKMSIVSKEISFSRDQEITDHLINLNRPYNVEKRSLQSYVNFKVISQYFAYRCLEEALNQDHKLALIMNRKEVIIMTDGIIWRGKK